MWNLIFIFISGFTDFAPTYSGKPRKAVKSENFVHLTRRAEQWFQSNSTSSLQLVNVQTLDHNMLFKCIRDGIGMCHFQLCLYCPNFLRSFQINSAIHKAAVRPAAVQNVVWRAFQLQAPFMAYGGFRNWTRQNHGMAGNREAGSFVNSAVRNVYLLEENNLDPLPVCSKFFNWHYFYYR